MNVKISLLILLVGTVLFVDAGPGRRGRKGRRRNRKPSGPVCECDELESCVADKKVNFDQCKNNCTGVLDAAGIDQVALHKCFEEKKAVFEGVHKCMESELGKRCNNGTTEGGARKKRGAHGGKRKHKGGNGGRREHKMPPALLDFKTCVHDCARGNEVEGERVKRDHHGKYRRRHPGQMAAFACMKELECRPLKHPRDKVRAAHEKCKPEEGVDKKAMFQAVCQCMTNAGVKELECVPPTKETREKRQADDGDDDDEDDNDDDDDEDDDDDDEGDDGFGGGLDDGGWTL